MSSHLRSSSGFTIIEIVVVIVLLGIVAAVAIPRFSEISENSKIAATEAEMQMIKRAIIGSPRAMAGGRHVETGFEGDVGFPPAALTDLASKPDSIPAYDKFMHLGWHGPYIDTAGNDYLRDAWGAVYRYDASSRTLSSVGGEDTITLSF